MPGLRRGMSDQRFQIVVLGSGFAGSLTAMIARRLGFSTALLERGRHPRFAIGESSTPLANLLLEEIAADYDLPVIRPLSKWGTWQKQLPRLACGLKRGFTFYHHEFDRPFAPDPERRQQLLVGASPREEVADTHWYRPDFDHYLAQQAQALGVEFWDETILDHTAAEPDAIRFTGTRHGRPFEITADFAVDATGPRGFLTRSLGLAEKAFDSMPPTQALFSHFRNVGPLPDAFFSAGQTPPYPPEQAAVHHVFPGGWVWVLKFNNGITSAGVAATDDIANDLDFKSGQAAWRRLLRRLPSLREIFEPAEAVLPFLHSPRPAFRSTVVAGSHWALLPSAAGFVDPLLSTGFPLTLLGVTRLAGLLKLHWRRPSFRPQLEDYSQLTLLELDSAARLVGALYATMDRFELFRQLSLLYFAAASFSETARRLGKFHLADSFLLCRHPAFGLQFRQLCELARQPLKAGETANVQRQVRAAIEPLDVAGLTDASRHPWYPSLAADMLRGAPKLGASEPEIRAMLRQCGLNGINDSLSSGRPDAP
jgi:tetracycline 7-halogenase / FADH2 O2-dependent halogenase